MRIPKTDLTSPVPVADGGTGSSTAADAAEALGVGATDTPTFAGINLGDENLNDYDEGTFTPTVTLVGGAGNTVPVFTNNIGRYTRIGRMVYAQIALNGDGGAEGAGTGRVVIALPIAASASSAAVFYSVGETLNGATYKIALGDITGGSTTIGLYDAVTGASIKGDDLNNASRWIWAAFSYEV